MIYSLSTLGTTTIEEVAAAPAGRNLVENPGASDVRRYRQRAQGGSIRAVF